MAKTIVEPVKSFEDNREYRVIQLANELRCFLVSDAETDKAACAMDVRVGHYCDPKSVSGIAHFLEHMIFLGTEKYPDESSFEKFLTMHGGRTNAYTSEENTNFFFDVNQDHLNEAIKRFASFFSCPLFTQSATDREMQAIESEHSKNLQNDAWKLMQLTKFTSDPQHVFHKFGTGNIKTLKEEPLEKGIDVRKELFTFYETYYSANIMYLVVLGRESLDVLQQWVTDEFSSIPNRNVEVPKFPGIPFTPDYLKRGQFVVPVKDLRNLNINWPMPEMRSRYKTKEYHFFSHLLGHEGPGSILSCLKTREWVNELAAGLNHSESGFSIFTVSVDLTELGCEHVNDIIHIIFQYLDDLRNITDEKWHDIFEELRDVNAMNFRFKSKETPISYVPSLASNVYKYDPDDILSGPWLFYAFDVEAIKQMLSYFTPSNMRYDVISQKFKGQTDLTEKWYGTEYKIEQVPEEVVQNQWGHPEPNKDLSLPEKNQFIATDFTVFDPSEDEKKNEYPINLFEDADMECWYKLDTQFKKPKCCVIIHIISPEAYLSPRNYVLTSLFAHYLQHSLNEFAYAADICGLSYTLTSSNSGLQLFLSGYNQKMHVLFEKIIDRMKSLEMEESRFNIFKDSFTRKYKNFWQEQPFQHVVYNQLMSLENRRWHNSQYQLAIADLTVEDLIRHKDTIFRNCFLQCLVNGNMTKESALELCHCAKDTLKYDSLYDGQQPDLRVVQLVDGHSYIHSMIGSNPSDSNSAICSAFQIGPNEMKEACLLAVFAHLAQQPCYEQLRTKEQLGYIVWSGSQAIQNIIFFRIIVQSSERSPEFLDARIEAFLHQFRKSLEEMSEESFCAHRDAVIALILEKDRKLVQTAQRFWAEIASRRYVFDRAHRDAEYIRGLQKRDVIDFFDEFIAQNAPKRRKISSQSCSTQENNKPTPEGTADGEDTEHEAPSKEERLNAFQVRFGDEGCTRTPIDIVEEQTELKPKKPPKIVHIEDFTSFKRSLMLYPDYFWKKRSRL